MIKCNKHINQFDEIIKTIRDIVDIIKILELVYNFKSNQ
ncbi:hypothetical protein QEE_1993 [Clostridioides difficile CD113]|nr:hypothetical protein QEE_1993 [Clostridioides difficile CD113]